MLVNLVSLSDFSMGVRVTVALFLIMAIIVISEAKSFHKERATGATVCNYMSLIGIIYIIED